MNELSPGGSYRPVTSNQQNQMRPFRSAWEDDNIDKPSTKPLVVNIRPETRSRSTLRQRSPHEELSKTSLPSAIRLKRSANGSSDPRFKRVLSPGVLNDACVGTEGKTAKPSTPIKQDEQLLFRQEHKPKQHWEESKNPGNNVIDGEADITAHNATNSCDPAKNHMKNVDNYACNREVQRENLIKQSVSDCTINTRNTSLVSEDLGDDYADRLQSFPSTTRVRKVQNWIAEQKPKIVKRQSVVTVIGQTQGRSTLSSALNEIDQRRKLVKELDRYAICSKITDSAKDREMSTLVAQINFLSPTGKFVHLKDRKVDSFKKNSIHKIKSGTGRYPSRGEKYGKRMGSSYESRAHGDNETNTERDASISPSSDGSSNRNQKQSNYMKSEDEYDIKGKIRQIVSRIPHPWLAYFLLFLSGTLCWYSFLALQRNGIFIFDMFPRKPKNPTLYEKICYWVWEIFRPSSSYRRSSSWTHR